MYMRSRYIRTLEIGTYIGTLEYDLDNTGPSLIAIIGMFPGLGPAETYTYSIFLDTAH